VKENETSSIALFTVNICISAFFVLMIGEVLDFSNFMFNNEAIRIISLALRVFGVFVIGGTLLWYFYKSTKNIFKNIKAGVDIISSHVSH